MIRLLISSSFSLSARSSWLSSPKMFFRFFSQSADQNKFEKITMGSGWLWRSLDMIIDSLTMKVIFSCRLRGRPAPHQLYFMETFRGIPGVFLGDSLILYWFAIMNVVHLHWVVITLSAVQMFGMTVDSRFLSIHRNLPTKRDAKISNHSIKRVQLFRVFLKLCTQTFF